MSHSMYETSKRKIRRAVIAVSLVAVAPFFLAAPATAADFGLRGGVYTDQSDAFVGVELLSKIGRDRWFFNPNAEYVFVENGDLLTLNVDVHYDLTLNEPINFWVGGGLAVIFRNHPRRDNETDAGLNLLAGVGFKPRGSLRPYVQGKLILSDESEGVIAVGVRF